MKTMGTLQTFRKKIIMALPLLLAGCSRLDMIPPTEGATPAKMLESHHHLQVSLGSLQFILMEPSSSVLVFLLGIITIAAGLHFMRTRGDQRSRLWWGISLILWGAGAILAGVSYQSFGYEIKCAGRELCAWTSWWEVLYLLCTGASINAMMAAVAHASAENRLKKIMTGYAVINTVLYTIACLTGAFLPNSFLVSFELMVLVTTPHYIVFFGVNTLRYARLKERMDLRLMFTWLGLALVMAAYFTYLALGYTEKLWAKGIWFSANDVLHTGLIAWMLYIGLVASKDVKDN